MTPETSSGEAVRNMLMIGTGLGITFPLYTVAVQNAFRRREMGVVSSAGELFRGVGGTIGSTVFGLVMANRFAAEMDASLLRMDPDHVASVPPGLITQMVKNPQQLGRASAIPPQFLDLIQASMSTAITGLFVIGLGLMVVALVVNFWLPEAPLRDTWDEPEGQEAADETGR